MCMQTRRSVFLPSPPLSDVAGLNNQHSIAYTRVIIGIPLQFIVTPTNCIAACISIETPQGSIYCAAVEFVTPGQPVVVEILMRCSIGGAAFHLKVYTEFRLKVSVQYIQQ